MTKAFWTIAFLVVFSVFGVWLATEIEQPFRSDIEYRCAFAHINGTFTAPKRILQGDSQLVIVRRGERVFMLKRSDIKNCELIE